MDMKQKEKVLLFGRGMVYQRKKEALFKQYEPAAFLDNAVQPGKELVTDEETGAPVIHPSDIGRYPGYPVILLSYALGDMYGQLLSLGISEERILLGPALEPYNTFEKLLFENGGRLVFRNSKICYVNEKQGLCIQTNPSGLEDLKQELLGSSKYPDAQGLLKELPLYPLDDAYGMNRGTPVDRYYIEQFLEAQREYIHGTVMEIGDRSYTQRFGGERVTDSIVLHVAREDLKNRQIKGNFATGEGLTEESIDCLICTQTLPFIYDLRSAADNMLRILKKGGAALVTAAGISQIIQYERIHYGHYWSFTEDSFKRLFEENGDVDSVEVFTYGNVKTAAAFLYGISQEELDREDFAVSDSNYQLIIAAVVKKR